ncbi:DUF6351 family protein [Streptomyces rishiriensis]|uniref:DUF6351 family protein n=1 Tax=Streptomyces rishiriensis TaxID=68264 RepID=UPI001FEB4F85|nr:DUF6351 family protein [Streptomyces rishiriensis]
MVAFSLVLAGAAHSAPSTSLRVRVLSNRADLVSGGDALVEVVLPSKAKPAKVRVDVDGRDVTPAFAVRPDGRFLGLVTGLKVGENRLTARGQAGTTRLTITNHPLGGPVFAGRQVQPWTCATEANGLGRPEDATCNTPKKYQLFYKSSATGQFRPYDPSNPPRDLARTTTDQGHNVPYIVRRERGTMDRGIYDIAVLYEPGKPWKPWAPQPGFDGKVLVPFGGDCTPRHTQGAPDNFLSGGVLQDHALSRGFAVFVSNLNTLGQNCNDVVSAEALMMLKEHFVEAYGPIRYTIGQGCSGGAMQQHWIASNYPGLVDGLLPSCSFPDIWETMQEAEDCHLLARHFDNSPLWAKTAQRVAVEGYAAEAPCRSWDNPKEIANYAKIWLDPDNGVACLGGQFGGHTPPEPNPPWVYDAKTNPKGVRCTLQDYMVAVFGRRPSDGFANRPYDNVGVQYGLKALESGEITAEQFVDVNENIGGLDIDWNWQPERGKADSKALEIAYRSGRVTYPRQAAKVPIIDLRDSTNLDIHTDFHSYAMRKRLIAANANAGNQIIWTSPGPLLGNPAVNEQAFLLMDKWLSAIEADTSTDPLEAKVVRNKPAAAVDACWIAGKKVTDMSVCREEFPYFGDPRIAAGGPLADNILKCRVKPLDRRDYTVDFTHDQWDRLRKTFPEGVCDYREPGVAQQPSLPWLTFAGGPGGQPLGPPPQSGPDS